MTKFLVCWFVFFAFLFIGCGSGDNDGGWGRGLPPVPAVSGGSVEEHGDSSNTLVNYDNFSKFLDTLAVALGQNNWLRAARGINKYNEIIEGKSGYIDLHCKYGDKVFEGYQETNEMIFFNFSQSDRLFFGGAIGLSRYIAEMDFLTASKEEFKINGKLDFMGAFKGSILFDNFHIETGSSLSISKILDGKATVISEEDIEVPEKFGARLIWLFFDLGYQ